MRASMRRCAARPSRCTTSPHSCPFLSASPGHYIAYVRCGDAWFLCDDASVSQVTPAKVLAAGAYLLFYQRQAPRRVEAADGAAEAVQAG